MLISVLKLIIQHICLIKICFSLSVRSICATPTIYSYAIAQCRRLFDIGLEVGHKMEILDVGDGFPSMSATDGLSFDQIAESLNAAFALFFPSKFFNDVKIIAEPGPYFAASSFSLITRVVDKRLIDGSFLTNDGKFLHKCRTIVKAISDTLYLILLTSLDKGRLN